LLSRLRHLFRRVQSLETASKTAERNANLAAWNVKVLGSRLAAELYAQGRAGHGVPAPAEPVVAGLTGRLCTQADIESAWLRHWCGQLHFVPVYHRKVWEDCYALQALWEHGMLTPGKRGLGFAVGEEWLPAYFAARGIDIMATDLQAEDERARQWIDTGQHGGARDKLFKPNLVGEAEFDARVTVAPADMNNIPAEFHGQYDFLWSVCSFEHCGSIDHGLDFVFNAMKCLRPGGVAVHTTEFNMDPSGPTLETGNTVLFQRKHIESLSARLREAGHVMLPVDFDPGSDVLDQFVDLPPFPGPSSQTVLKIPEAPHLRISIAGLVSTSVGLIIRAGGHGGGPRPSPLRTAPAA
jgi:hypothetical protein